MHECNIIVYLIDVNNHIGMSRGKFSYTVQSLFSLKKIINIIYILVDWLLLVS